MEKDFYDGILGMGYTSIAESHAKTVFENMVDEGLVSEPVFAMFLAHYPTGGELTLGGTDSSHYTGDIVYTPVTKQEFWQFLVDSVQVAIRL